MHCHQAAGQSSCRTHFGCSAGRPAFLFICGSKCFFEVLQKFHLSRGCGCVWGVLLQEDNGYNGFYSLMAKNGTLKSASITTVAPSTVVVKYLKTSEDILQLAGK